MNFIQIKFDFEDRNDHIIPNKYQISNKILNSKIFLICLFELLIIYVRLKIFIIYIIFSEYFKHLSLMQKTAQISQYKSINEILCKLQLLTPKMSKQNYYSDMCLYIQQLIKRTDRQSNQLYQCNCLNLEMKEEIKLKNKELKKIQKNLLIKIEQHKKQLSTKNEKIIQLNNRIVDLQEKNKRIKAQEHFRLVNQVRDRNNILQNQLKFYKNNVEDLIQKNKELVPKIMFDKVIEENKVLTCKIGQLESIQRQYGLLKHQKQNIQYQLYKSVEDYQQTINKLHVKFYENSILSNQNLATCQIQSCKSSETCESASFDIYEFSTPNHKKKYKSKKNILKIKGSNQIGSENQKVMIFQNLQDQRQIVSVEKSKNHVPRVIGMFIFAMLMGCL